MAAVGCVGSTWAYQLGEVISASGGMLACAEAASLLEGEVIDVEEVATRPADGARLVDEGCFGGDGFLCGHWVCSNATSTGSV